MSEHVCTHVIRNGVSHIIDGNEGSMKDVMFLDNLMSLSQSGLCISISMNPRFRDPYMWSIFEVDYNHGIYVYT